MATSAISTASVQSLLQSSNSNASSSSSGSTSSASSGSVDLQIISQLQTSTSGASSDDAVSLDPTQLYSNSLSVLAQQVLSKLQQASGSDLPSDITTLKPEDHTPEKTAQNIVDGVTALYSVYAKQNPGLDSDTLLQKFLDTVRGGIQDGYSQAQQILDSTGASQIDGVTDGIDKTKDLVEQGLQAFEARIKAQNSGTSTSTTPTTNSTSSTSTSASTNTNASVSINATA